MDQEKMVDDKGTIVYDEDWLFIGYRQNGEHMTKFVLQQDGFLDMLDEFGPDCVMMSTLELVSGKEWRKANEYII